MGILPHNVEMLTNRYVCDVKKAPGIAVSNIGQILRTQVTDFCKLEKHRLDESRFIPAGFVFLGSRCQVRRIGFNKEPFQRDMLDQVSQIGAPFLKGQDAGDSDEKPQIKIVIQFWSVAAEAVNHATAIFIGMGFQYFQESSMTVPFMQDQGQS